MKRVRALHLFNPHDPCVYVAFAVAIVVCGFAVPEMAYCDTVPCPQGVRISGPQVLVQKLRVSLSQPTHMACYEAEIVRLETGLRITLRRGGKTVSRTVEDVRMASVWLSTWMQQGALRPTARTNLPQRSEDTAAKPVVGARTDLRKEPSEHTKSWDVGVEGRAGLDDRVGAWGGADLSIFGTARGWLCFGGGLGLIWAEEGEGGQSWDDVHASLRVGGFADRHDWRFRALLGSGLFTGAVGSDGEKVLDGGFFGEAIVGASYAIAGPWRLTGGFSVRASSSSKLNRWNREQTLNRAVLQIPSFAASTHLGVAFAFGERD